MCCKSATYGNMNLHGYKHAVHHNIHENVCTDSKNSLHGYGNSNCWHTSVNMTKNKVCCNIWLNVEAPCFLDNLYEDYNFNIFALVFGPKVNLNIGVKGPAYINNAGWYTIYGNMPSANISLLKQIILILMVHVVI